MGLNLRGFDLTWQQRDSISAIFISYLLNDKIGTHTSFTTYLAKIVKQETTLLRDIDLSYQVFKPIHCRSTCYPDRIKFNTESHNEKQTVICKKCFK